MTRKIVFLFSPGPFGGAERVILTGAQLIPNCEIWIIKESRNSAPANDFSQRCIEKKIISRQFSCSSRFDYKTFLELRKTIKEENIELVHSHGLKANFYNCFLPVIRIATQHGKTSHSLKVRALEFIEHLALKKMDAIICVSSQMFKQVSYPKKKLIENFLSFKMKKSHYSNQIPVKLVSIGRLSPEKGISDIVHIVKNDNTIELTIVGTGSEEARLRQAAQTSQNIKFAGFQEDVSPYLEGADALIIPSHREGLPMILIEACAAGLPILASNVGGMPSLVKENGYLFEAQSINSIKEAINNFLANREYINNQAKLASKRIQEEYSQQKWKEATLQLYESLL